VDGEFTGSNGRTIKFRYELQAGWSADEPRGVLIYFHGNATGTQEDMLDWNFPYYLDFAGKFDLVPVVVASPEARPTQDERRWQYESTAVPHGGHGVRIWRLSDDEDVRLVHELLQSEFGGRFRVDFDQVVFIGASAGACFLNRFVLIYAGSYGGGVLLDCGCFLTSPTLPFATWNPPDDFRGKFRVIVRSTKGDFLYRDSQSAYSYYKYVVGLDTRGDLEADGEHCSRGDVTQEEAVDWLLNGTGLPDGLVSPHFKRVSVMDELVGVTVDRDGALWAARQGQVDSQAVILRSVDRGESLEALAQVGMDVHDIDAVGDELVFTVNQDGIQSLHSSSNMGRDFRRLDLDGGSFFSNSITDIHDNLYAIAPGHSGGQEVYLSEDNGRSWTPLGAPLEGHIQFANPDPIQTTDQSAFLALTVGYGRSAYIGATSGNDWNLVGTFQDELYGSVKSMAWDGTVFWGVGQPYVDSGLSHIPKVFTSTDRGATWEEEPLPKLARVSSFSRVSAIGNGEVLFAGGGHNWGTDGYLRGADGSWRRIFGGETIGRYPRATIDIYGNATTRSGYGKQYRIAVDRIRGDVYLTDGQGIFRLDGRFRAEGAVGHVQDADGDGVPDALDAFPSDGSEQLDTDGDGVANGVDDDDDGDGVEDVQDDLPLDRFETVDTDGNGVGNGADRDDDGDGVEDVIDAFPLDASLSADSDGDGIGDGIDEDDDGDGVRDIEDAFPKYPHEWLDTDKDGIGDNIDFDDDNDSIPDPSDPKPKSGQPRPHLLPLTVLPYNLWHLPDSGWLETRAHLHSDRPVTHIYPKGAGQSQDYGQLSLGNGLIPDVQFMIDHLDGVSLLYFDRNNNGDLSDDGPPVRQSPHDNCCPYDLLQVEVTYASGITIPYTISHSHLPQVQQGGGWIGEAELPGGAAVLVLTIDRDIDGLFTGASDYVCVDTDGDHELDCGNIDSPERFANGDVATLAGKRLRVLVVESGHRVEFEVVRTVHPVSLFPAAAHPEQQGFVRVMNRSGDSAVVEILAFDGDGVAHGPASLSIDAGATVHFNSEDLEQGNADKGLSDGIGSGGGAWRLELSSESDIEVLGYIRTMDGFVTSMHDRVPLSGGQHDVPTFNPGSNHRQVSRLRLVNPSTEAAVVTIAGVDDGGALSPSAQVAVPGGASRELTARQLESGDAEGLSGALGDGQGKWWLTVESDNPIQVMSLMESPTGHLSNISTRPPEDDEGVHRVPLFPAASHATQQGFARVVNRSSSGGTVEITAFDDSGVAHGPVSLSMDGSETVHFNSDDLELGNTDKGLSAGVGEGAGTWRLELRSDLDIEVLGYIRTADGFVTSMHDLAALRDGRHYVPFLNPGSNNRQVSRLRLTNPGAEDASVSIEGTDDGGTTSPTVRVTVPAGASRGLSAQQLETGDADGLTGSLGDGQGKWRLSVESDVPIHVMSVLESPTGHLTNLSTAPSPSDGG